MRAENGAIVIDDREVRVLAERGPDELPWGELGVELVIEPASGTRA